MVTLSHLSSFSIKTRFYEINNIFYLENKCQIVKTNVKIWKYTKNKFNVMLDNFPN